MRRTGRVSVGAFDLTPEVLEAVRAGKLLFTVDQQPYLQGYLPGRDARQPRPLRAAALPGRRRRHRRELRHAENADQAIELSRRSIR